MSKFQTHRVVHCCKQPCCAKLMCCDHCNKAALPRLKGQQSSTEHSSCCGCCISLKQHGSPLTDSKMHVDAAMSEQAWSNEPHLESLPRCVAHHRCHCCATKHPPGCPSRLWGSLAEAHLVACQRPMKAICARCMSAQQLWGSPRTPQKQARLYAKLL